MRRTLAVVRCAVANTLRRENNTLLVCHKRAFSKFRSLEELDYEHDMEMMRHGKAIKYGHLKKKQHLDTTSHYSINEMDLEDFFLDYRNCIGNHVNDTFLMDLRHSYFKYGYLTTAQSNAIASRVHAFKMTRSGRFGVKRMRNQHIYADPVICRMMALKDEDFKAIVSDVLPLECLSEIQEPIQSMQKFYLSKGFLTEKQLIYAASLMYQFFIPRSQRNTNDQRRTVPFDI